MSAKSDIVDVLTSDEFHWSRDDGHKAIARKLHSEGYFEGLSIHTLRSNIGEARREGDVEAKVVEDLDSWASEEEASSTSSNVNYRKRNYYYNQEDDVYVVYPENRSETLVIDGSTIRSIKKDYSNWSGDVATINEICRTHAISRKDFVSLKRTLGFTHADSPFTDEQLTSEKNTIDDHLRDLARERERDVQKAWQKKKWRQTEKEARKWREFKKATLEPLYESIERTPIDESHREFESVSQEPLYWFPHLSDGHLDQLNNDGTGAEDNIKRWLDALNQNLKRSSATHGTPEKIVVALGSDQFNIDDPRGRTTSGTPQDQSIVGSESFFRVADAGVEAIEMARDFGPVEVRVWPGNHDWRSCQAYYWGLQQKYENTEVEITGDASVWQFGVYGENFIGWQHGDKVKGGKTKQNEELSSIMLQLQESSEASHFYFFLGHLHHLEERDKGVHTLQAPTTTTLDRWHNDEGYGSNANAQTCYIFQESGGQIARYTAYT